MSVQHVVRPAHQSGLQVAEEGHPKVGLNVVETIRKQLEQGVEDPPAALLEHLREELVQEALDPQGLQFRVDQESGMRKEKR